MRYLLAGGGTAGHINPALAIATTIKEKEPDAKILFVGNLGGMEEKLVKMAGYDFAPIKISGIKRSFTPKAIVENTKTAIRVITSSFKSKKIIKDFKPDICIGTGGYVSGPILRKAAKMGIPTVIHEQNAYPGVTTKILAKSAKVIMLAIEDAKKHLNKSYNFVVTGNPLRQEIIMADKEKSRKKLNLDSRPVILSFGGSLGARKINEAMVGIIERSGKDKKYQHIHGYGQYGTWFPDLVLDKGIDVNKTENLHVTEYINNMPQCLAAADLVICRAGAVTISELQVKGKPSILIPSPNVTENHQYHNAMALVNEKAASIIEEKDLTEDEIINKVDTLIKDSGTLKEYSENAKSMAIDDANIRIYNVIKNIANK